MHSSVQLFVALAAVLLPAANALGDAADGLVARVATHQACYSNTDYVSCVTSYAKERQCQVTATGNDLVSCNCATIASALACQTSYCTQDDVYTGLTQGIDACSTAGFGSGGGGGAVPTTDPGANTGGTQPGPTSAGAAASSSGKNAGSMTTAFIGSDHLMTSLFAAAWIVGLAGLML
ncbi:hypothetical protein GQ53DRAFT_772633 [Thozetella sp. PMI_491]|nr:hypothetical protein GQ53DRAFT_772633 [Thozetella sp. PMI_491]